MSSILASRLFGFESHDPCLPVISRLNSRLLPSDPRAMQVLRCSVLVEMWACKKVRRLTADTRFHSISRFEDVDILISIRPPISGGLIYVFLIIETGPLSDINEISRCCAPCCSSLGWRARASYIDSMVAVSQFILIFGLESVDTSSAVKLSSQNFIGLTETIELTCKVSVLSLQAVCMLLKCVSFSCEIGGVGLILCTCDS